MTKRECRIKFVDGSDEGRCTTHNRTVKRETPFAGVVLYGFPTNQLNCPEGDGPIPIPGKRSAQPSNRKRR